MEVVWEWSPKVYDNFFDKKTGRLKPSRFKVIAGGRGKSATYSFMQMGIQKSFEIKNGIGCFTREIKESLDKSSKERLEAIIVEKGLENYFDMREKETRNIITGTKFIYNGLSTVTADTFKGSENIDFCHIGEAHTIQKKPLQKLMPTIRKPGSEIWVDYNPENAADAVHEFFTKNPLSYPYLPNPEVNRLLYLLMTYKDNPFLTKELHEQMLTDKANFPEDFDWIWLGKLKENNDRFLATAELVQSALNRKQKIDVTSPVVVGADIAHMGGDYIVFYKRQGYSIIDKFKKKRLRSYQTLQELENFVGFDKSVPIFIDNGNLGASIADELELDGYCVNRVNFGGTTAESKLYDPEHSYDVSTDMLRKCVKEFLPYASIPKDLEKDNELFCQLTQRKWDFVQGERGVIKIESKQSFKEHYTGKQKSPDDMDAFILCTYGEYGGQNCDVGTLL